MCSRCTAVRTTMSSRPFTGRALGRFRCRLKMRCCILRPTTPPLPWPLPSMTGPRRDPFHPRCLQTKAGSHLRPLPLPQRRRIQPSSRRAWLMPSEGLRPTASVRITHHRSLCSLTALSTFRQLMRASCPRRTPEQRHGRQPWRQCQQRHRRTTTECRLLGLLPKRTWAVRMRIPSQLPCF